MSKRELKTAGTRVVLRTFRLRLQIADSGKKTLAKGAYSPLKGNHHNSPLAGRSIPIVNTRGPTSSGRLDFRS